MLLFQLDIHHLNYFFLFQVLIFLLLTNLLFMKNLAVAGGFLVLFAAGAGAYSVDKD